MAAVADLERFLERLFERTSARVFRARLQAVQVERRVERAMEAARDGRGASTTVPSRYRVRLHPADLDDLAARSDGAAALAGRLADAALAFARQHAYHLRSRPTVILVADIAVERGRIDIDALTDAPAAPDARSEPAPPAEPSISAEPLQDERTAPDAPSAPVESRGPAPGSAPEPAAPAPPPVPIPATAPVPVPAPSPIPSPEPVPAGAAMPSPAHGIRDGAGEAVVFRRPAPPPARAVLRLTTGGRERTVEVGATPTTIGRATDNEIVLADNRISRHHGRLQARRGTLVYTDLGSTNGSRVNGIRADEIVLGLGDRLQLGDVVLVVEALPG